MNIENFKTNEIKNLGQITGGCNTSAADAAEIRRILAELDASF